MVRKISTYSIISVFLRDYGRRFYLRELADELARPHQTIKPYVEELVGAGILNEIRRRKLVEYTLNLSNPLVIHHLVIAESERAIDLLSKEKALLDLYKEMSLKGSTLIAFGKAKKLSVLNIGTSEASSEILSVENTPYLESVEREKLSEIFSTHTILNNTETVVRHLIGRHMRNEL